MNKRLTNNADTPIHRSARAAKTRKKSTTTNPDSRQSRHLIIDFLKRRLAAVVSRERFTPSERR